MHRVPNNRDALLLALMDLLREGEPEQTLYEVCQLIGTYFKCARVGLRHLDEEADMYDFRACWTDGSIPALQGRRPASAFGQDIVRVLRSGESVAISDLLIDPLSSQPVTRELARELETRAVLVVPFLWAGRLRSMIYLNHRTPRQWTREEVGLVEEIADRTRRVIELAEVARERNETMARLRFLDALSNETAKLADAEAILKITARMTGEHMHLSSVAYSDMDIDGITFTVRTDWNEDGSTSIAGRYSLADFGDIVAKTLWAGGPLILNNVEELPAEQAKPFLDLGIKSTACFPLVKDGVFKAATAFHYSAPHDWTDSEITLIREVTTRSWAHVERLSAEAELRESETRLKVAIDAGRMAVWEIDLRTGGIVGSPELNKILGFPEGATPSPAEIRERYYPGERERIEQHGRDVLARGERFVEAEYRYRWPNGEVRWLLQRCEVQFDGPTPVRAVGVITDVTAWKKSEELRELLVAELSHRVKNSLATVLSIHRQSFSRATNQQEARKSFEERVLALSQTHTRLAEESWSGISLATLVLDELRPYRSQTGDNIRVAGPDVTLRPNAALTLGLGIHELATNAAKYGSLSVAGGNVLINWSVTADCVAVEWKELNGPPVLPPVRSGFGRLLIERGLIADLKGLSRLSFEPGGVTCHISFPVEMCAFP